MDCVGVGVCVGVLIRNRARKAKTISWTSSAGRARRLRSRHQRQRDRIRSLQKWRVGSKKAMYNYDLATTYTQCSQYRTRAGSSSTTHGYEQSSRG